jgi:glycosyltransferase involved in cell wall biosynthesis
MAHHDRRSIEVKPSVSVLTLVKGRIGHLDRLIEGLRQSETPPGELIVVDMDGDWVAPTTSYPIRVLVMRRPGLPLAAARNAAATAAASDLLLFLDVDCIPMPRLAGLANRELNRLDALICAEVRYLAAGQPGDGDTASLLWGVAQSHPLRRFPDEGLRPEPNYGLFWSLAFALRRKTFFELGAFDEGFTGYGAEDTDFGFRSEAAGIPLMFLGGAGVLHQHHAVFDPPLQHFTDIVRNARRFHAKWGMWPMRGWLDAFAARGLICLGADEVQIIRLPTADEVLAAALARPF